MYLLYQLGIELWMNIFKACLALKGQMFKKIYVIMKTVLHWLLLLSFASILICFLPKQDHYYLQQWAALSIPSYIWSSKTEQHPAFHIRDYDHKSRLTHKCEYPKDDNDFTSWEQSRICLEKGLL